MRIRACLLVVFIALVWLGFESVRPKAFVDGGPFAYISNVNDGTVSVIDITSNTVVDTVTVGPIPIAVAVNASGSRVYVTTNGSNSLAVIDTTTTPQSVSSIPVGSGPYGVAINSIGTRAYVTNYNDATVSVVNTANNSVIATIPVGDGPRGVVVSYNNSFVYTANFLDNSVTVINANTNAVVTTVDVGAGPYGINITPDNSKVYVANNGTNTLSVISTASNTVSATITVGNNPIGLGITPSGDRLYCADDGDNTVTVVDIATDSVIGNKIPTGFQPDGVTVSPDGAFAYVVNFGSDNVTVINTATNTVLPVTIPVGSAPSSLGSFIGPINSSLQLSAATYTANEIDGSLTVTVTRSGNSNNEVAVNYATSNGTALDGSDYTAASGSVTIPAGETSATFNVAIANDSDIEDDETFNITLSNPSTNASLGATVTAVVTIQSDDLPQPGQLQFDLSSINSTEASGTVNVAVTRSSGSDGAVTVDYAVTGGTATVNEDFTLTAGTLTFADGVTSQNITLNISEDILVEGSENITLTLSNAGGGATLGANTTSTINISDNDTAANLSAAGSLDFGDVLVNGTKALTVTLSNTGTNSLTLTQPFSITGSNASEFSVNTPANLTIAGNSSIDVTVNFNPTSAGSKSAAIAFSSDANSVSVNLSGVANTAANLTASLSSLSFGDVLVNGTKSLTVTLSNTGTNSLTLTQPFSFSGSNASEFSVNALSNTTLAGGSSVDVTVNFNPTSAGNKSATLSINTTTANSVTVDLTGVANTPGNLSANLSTANFGSVLVGNQKNLKVTLTNTGTTALTLTPPFSISGSNASEFSVDALSSTTLSGNSSIDLSLNFNPTSVGSKSASISVTSDTNNVTINLTGEANTAANLTADLTSVNFGSVLVGSQKTLKVKLSNTGTTALTLSQPFSITGANASEFSVATLSNTTIAGNSSVDLNVTLSSATPGSKSATLTVSSNANNVTINLNGDAGSAGNLTSSISNLDFGTVSVTGQKSLTVTLNNTGANSLTLQQPFIITGTNNTEFSVNTLSNVTLAGGASTELTINFAPTTEGSKSATLSIGSNTNNININLIGTAQPAIINQLTLNANEIDFGSISSGTTKSFSLMVTNNSSSVVNLINPSLISGSHASAFVTSNFTITRLNPGASALTSVQFRPNDGGLHTATLTLRTDIGQLNVPLRGNCSTLSVSLKNLSFGMLIVGATKDLNFSITNRGKSVMTLSTPFAISGVNADQFSVVRVSSTNINPGSSATVTVRYQPTSIGDKTATLTVAAGTESETVSLNGTTVSLVLSASSHDFGSVVVGSTGEFELVLSNQGSSNITISSVTISGETTMFKVTQAPATSLAAGASTSAKVSFKPTVTGVRNGTLIINTNQGRFTVSLTGNGTR